ncbi:MAG: carboxypeptidase regulatory-like domain-containing protein, partial [Sediminibacterium sp.]
MRKLFLMVCLCIAATQVWAQGSKTITGRVTDEKGVPLSGATVFVNDRLAKQTDSDGGYSIVVPGGTTKFTVSYIGFASREVDLGNKTQVNVALLLEDKILSEVVVTGVGSATSKKKLGISVESVN